MTLYYVNKEHGNDSTGDGLTHETAWLTLDKAIKTVPGNAAASTVLIGDGTYVEGTTYWGINGSGTSFLNLVTFKPENDTYGGVIVQVATGTTYGILVNAIRNVLFDKINFSPAGTATNLITLYSQNAITNLSFTNCVITGGISINNYTNYTITNVLFDHCTIDTVKQSYNPTKLTDGITFQSCTIENGSGIDLIFAKNVLIDDCTISNTAGNYTLKIGTEDNYIENAETVDTVLITNCTISGDNHVVMLGSRSKNVTFGGSTGNGNAITSTGYGVVIKECVGAVVSYNEITITGVSSQGAILSKACISPVIQYNTVTASCSYCLYVPIGDSGHKSSGIDFQHNTLTGSGSNAIFGWATANDSGGGVCDYNTYDPSGSGKYGIVMNDTDVQDATELRLAWVTYNITNDSHSEPLGDAPNLGTPSSPSSHMFTPAGSRIVSSHR